MKPICKTELLSSKKQVPKSCDTRIVHIQNDVWYILADKNHWLYVLPKATNVTISCRNETAPFDLVLNGTGIFQLNGQCKAYTPCTMLIAQSSFESAYSFIVPTFNISDDDCCLRGKANISVIPQLEDVENLDVASHKLHTISTVSEEMSKQHKINRKLSVFTYIRYAIATITIIYVLYKTFRCCICKNNCYKLFMFKRFHR